MILDIIHDEAPAEQIQHVRKVVIDIAHDVISIVKQNGEEHISLEWIKSIQITND